MIDCSINGQKQFGCQKVFSQATGWMLDSVLIDNSTLHLSKEIRSCVSSSVGKPPGCNSPMERYVYFFWVHTKLTADNARTNCKQYSARLFDKLFDGGYSAIVFLAQHLQPEFHFLLGISDKQQDGLWLSSDGQKMNDYLANFIENEPNGGSVENNLAVQYRKLASGEYIRCYFDVNNQQMVSACYKESYEKPNL